MTDYPKALAAAREAAGMALFDDSPKAKHACVEALHDLLAALDAARGEAVAFLYTLEYGSSVADRRVSTYRLNYPFGVCGADYQRSNEDGVSYVRETPLYAAPPAAAVPTDFAEWLAREMPAGTVIGDPHWWAKLIARRFAATQTPPAALAVPAIPKALRDEWRSERGNSMTSAVGEYTPREFWDLLDAYEALLAQQPAAAVPEVLCTRCGRSTTHRGSMCYGCTLSSILVAEIERLRAKCEAMRAGYVPVSALIEARDHVEDWAAYSSPYFQEKHDLAGVLAEIDAQIAAAQAQQPAAAVPERGLRDSVLNSAKFRASCYALVGIVEGIEGLGRNWTANGERLKDTREWVAFYNCVAAMRNGTFNQASAEQAQQPAAAKNPKEE